MPKNPLIFPDNFLLDGTVADTGIGALEVAINNLSVASKSGAMRQANAIRIGGLGSIKNQNRGMPTLNSLLPTRSVGKFTVPPSEPSGTVGYFFGGFGENSSGQDITQQQTRVDRFTFATNTITNLGSKTNIHNPFVFSNSTYGYYCWGPNNIKFSARFTFQTESVASIGSVLFPGRYQGASLKNQTRGYACGGIGSAAGTIYGNVDRFSFAGEVCVSISTVLQVRFSHSGCGNRFNGYLCGGNNNPTVTSVYNNIERFSYATEINAAISAVLSIGRWNMSTWIPGSTTSAYLMSGLSYASFPTPPTSPVRIYFTNTIDKFTFAGETCAALGVTLTRGSRAYTAVGNNTRCVIAGGITHTDAYESQNVTIKESNEVKAITFATEVQEVLGCVLSIGRFALGGLDNSIF